MVRSVVFVLVLALVCSAGFAMVIPDKLEPPVVDDIWLRPAGTSPAEPTIGFVKGIRIGIWPSPKGPRGIIRIYAPYVLPEKKHALINFIAIEPIVNGKRSLSEIERSTLDESRGKRLWFSDEVDNSPTPVLPWESPSGKIGKIRVGNRDIRTLSIAINIEKLDNGAQPVVLATFREDRPNEVSFKVYATNTSAVMESCVLTATMGNYSRTRLLWLADEVVDSRKLWPDYTGNGFVGTPDYTMERMHKDKECTLTAAITPSETDLRTAKVDLDWWVFDGLVSTQYWRKYPGSISSPLSVRVNGRAVYYGTKAHIPGGVAFENFELIEKYAPGVKSSFGVTLKTPAEMGWDRLVGGGVQ